MLKKLFKLEYLNYLLITMVSLVSHWNTFFFPAYREDEGTYISQAWALVNSGSLAPYTYWYDHSPVGWFFIAFWNIISGGFLENTNSIIAGRIFIVILNVCSALLVYTIAKQLTHSKLYSGLSSLLFILTPLAIEFQRRVFIDNIMIFWLLWSIYFSIKPTKLPNVVLSAITFAIAVLSKESAIVFLPVLITSIYFNSHKNNRPFVTAAWLAFNIGIISFYPLYALIKGEFFVYGSFLGGEQPHVSLLQALAFQSGRSSGLFWEADSAFRQNLEQAWISKDAIFIGLGIVAAPLINFIFYRKYKWTGFIAMMAIIYILYLMRGQVLDWYIIPLLPLGAINLALLLQNLHVSMKKYLPNFEKLYVGAVTLSLVAIIGLGVNKNVDAYRYNQTENQRRTVEWIKNNIKGETTLLIDNYAFQDLNSDLKKITDTNIHYYWKADTINDPEIASEVFDNDWRNVDYVMLTPAITTTLNASGDADFQIVRSALENSNRVIQYNEFAIEGDPIANYPVEILEVNNFDFRLDRTWQQYKKNFITEAGQVIDPQEDNTTSRGQAYALLRSVWTDDKATFDSVLDWTELNLLKPNNLHASKLTIEENNEKNISNDNSSTDADIDIAFSLIQAANKWNSPDYQEKAQKILDSIWVYNVAELNNTLYLGSGDAARKDTGILVNASHYSPGMFRVFAQTDPNHDWSKLADDSYDFLNATRDSRTGLVPNWSLVDSIGTVLTAEDYIEEDSNIYGYDASRTYFRVALDKLWFNSQESKDFLNYSKNNFFQPYWENNYDIGTLYTLDGREIENYSDISTSAAAISVFHGEESTLDTEIYLNLLKNQEHSGHWGNQNNFDDQNWGWFATALYGDKLTNYSTVNNE